jgi:Flp pilus assembly protein TadG
MIKSGRMMVARSLVARLAGDERGAILPMVTVALPIIFGTTALAIDYGYVCYVRSSLQATTDAAALAGAQGLSDGTYEAKAKLYSSCASVGGINTIAGITVGTPTITGVCSSNMQMVLRCPLSGPGTSALNVIQVTQTAQVPLFFGSAIGLNPMTVSTTAFAVGAPPPPPVLLVRLIPGGGL